MKTSVSSAPADLAATIKGSESGRHFKRNLILALVVLVLGGGGENAFIEQETTIGH